MTPNPNSIPVASSLAPYGSFLVAHSGSMTLDTAWLANEVFQVIVAGIDDGGGVCEVVEEFPLLHPVGSLEFLCLYYTELRPVPWLVRGEALRDKLNHLIVVIKKGQFVAIYISDAGRKMVIQNALALHHFADCGPVDESVLIRAYIENQKLLTLWLGGTHRSVPVKPNSKVLAGDDLAEAIEPFGDSTFIAGAVRTAIGGVSLKRSGVWIGPTRDWNAFVKIADDLLNKLAASHATTGSAPVTVHAGLARRLNSFAGVFGAYHLEWASHDTLQGERRGQMLAALAEKFEIGPVQISTNATNAAAHEVKFEVHCIESNSIFIVTLRPEFDGNDVAITVIAPPGELVDFVGAIEGDAELLRVFYDSGHTLANASLSHAAIQDREFTGFRFKDFSPPGEKYDVKMEKPEGNPSPIANILTTGDESLFKWIYKEGLGQLNLSQPIPGVCWLYCDDRAGEVADFVHVDLKSNGAPRITLIHAKGASNKSANRRVAPGR